MLGVAVAAITSCTNDEVLDMNPQTAISFDGHVNKGTRAVIDTDGGLSTFYLIGGFTADAYNNVFNNIPVTKSSGSWSYGAAEVWTENMYYFGAYADKNSSAKISNVSLSNDATNGATLTFESVVTDDTKDLVAAVASQDGSTNKAQVDLTFNHLLSKIKFTLDNTDAKYKMTVGDIQVVVKDNANCTYSKNGAEWGAPADDETLTFPGKADMTSVDDYVSTDHLVIPGQTTANIYAEFVVTFKDADGNIVDTKNYTGTKKVSLGSATEWKAGYVYNYTAQLSAETNEIKFGATVSPWLDATPAPGL